MSRAPRGSAAAIAVGVAILVGSAATSARAARPRYDAAVEEESFAGAAGLVRVHFVRSSDDAVPAADGDRDGVPDFVAEVAERAEDVLTRLAAMGFRAPLADGDLADNGGDARFDLYLRDLALADGSFGQDDCTAAPAHCAGHVIMENDFVGYGYPSPSMGIRVLTSHELFHAVQSAYDVTQPIAWAEGSAVWAEEALFPEQGDFEGFVAAFLAKPFRPFDRAGGGFGDLYPYGAGLWPYFLEQRFGADLIAAIWEGCEAIDGDSPDFLDAADAVLTAQGSSLAAAWIEFTRWNATTGAYADPGEYPDAARLAEALREPLVADGAVGAVKIEGMSARYLPMAHGLSSFRLIVSAEAKVAAQVIAAGATVARADDDISDDDVAKSHEIDVLDATDAAIEVVITGTRRGAPPGDVTVTIEPLPPPTTEPAPESGGCQSGRGGVASPLALAMLVAMAALRRRAPNRRR